MTKALLVPIRIPELGPSLGRMVSGTDRRMDGIPLHEVRLRAVTRLFEHAGEARRLASNGERHSAITSLGRETWSSVWDQTVGEVTELALRQVSEEMESVAREARVPGRVLRRFLPSDHDRNVLRARLGSGGAPLVSALGALDQFAAQMEEATVDQRDALKNWQEALQRAGRRFAESCETMERTLDSELARLRAVTSSLATWKRSLTPVVAFFLIGEALAVWLGLVMGGFIDSPGWFSRVWNAVFG
ncbi:MAG: hypothetical protein IH877_01925 [Gemmatimonadetes bacterium]|nr:hypothetical protein [Gemmatimonadota bacterium]